MQKVSASEVVTPVEAIESPLPAQIQEALGELVGAAREGLLALSVGVGLGVVHELMALEVDEVVGPAAKHNPDRTAVRHGHEDGSMTLGGRRVPVRRPRMRTADGERELPVESYGYFADRDPLTRAVMDRMLAGVSSRRFADVGEPFGLIAASSLSQVVSEPAVGSTELVPWRVELEGGGPPAPSGPVGTVMGAKPSPRGQEDQPHEDRIGRVGRGQPGGDRGAARVGAGGAR